LQPKRAQRRSLLPNAAREARDLPAIDVSQKTQRHVERLLAHPANRVATRACAQLVGDRCGRAARALVEIDREKSAYGVGRFTQCCTPR
jgi:hypothetical protein